MLSQELNYRRAAEILFISQPALSAAIRQLEAAVGGRLFDRDTRSVALTDLGQNGSPRSEQALREVDLTLAAAADLVGHSPFGSGTSSAREPISCSASWTIWRRPPRRDGRDDRVRLLRPRPPDWRPGRPTSPYSARRSSCPVSRWWSWPRAWVACLPRAHRWFSGVALIAELLDEPIVVAPASAGPWRDYWIAADVRGDRPALIAAEAATYEAETTMVLEGRGHQLHHLLDLPALRPAGPRLRADPRPARQLHHGGVAP